YSLQQENKALTVQLVEKNRSLADLNMNLEALVEEKIADLMIQNRSLQLSQHILDILPVGIAGLDNDDRIVQVNNAAIELFGKGSKNIIGSYAREVIAEDIMAVAESIGTSEASGLIPEGSTISGRLFCIPLCQGAEQLGRIILLIPDK
ncbi:MAG: PAS domain-containing protein, partial [Pseudomonadota bacterium]